MGGTYNINQSQETIWHSYIAESFKLRLRANGDYQFDGERPVGKWHAHGYFSKNIVILDFFKLKTIRIWKRRWLNPDTGTTCHSRPSGDLPQLSFCTHVIILKLWIWLDFSKGIFDTDDKLCDLLLPNLPSSRTAQRWLARAIPDVLEVQKIIREVIIHKCEPRPIENLFKGDLSPPKSMLRRHWRNTTSVRILWTAFAMLIGAGIELNTPLAFLLAEARGRWHKKKASFPI